MPSAKTAKNVGEVVDVLQSVVLFQGLPRTDLERIARLVRDRTVDAGEMVFREGDPGEKFYIVRSGSVEAIKERPRGDVERLAVRRAGEAFGEMALLSDAHRSASVRALEPTHLLSVSRDQFHEILGGDSLAMRLLQGMARALRTHDVRFAARDTANSSGNGEGDGLREFSRVVQQGLLPRQVPELEHFDIAGAVAHADSSGGEATWDAFPSSDGAYLAVLDVKGSRLPPAYLLGITRAVLRQVAASSVPAEKVLPFLNTAVSQSVFEGLDECVQVGFLRFAGTTVQCALASEQPGLILRSNGTVEEIAPHGPPLGILPEFTFGSATLDLAKGETVVLFSSAERGLLKGAETLISSRKDETVRAMADHLYTALQRASGTACISFVIARRN